MSTAANEALYQHNPAPAATHTDIHYTHLHTRKAHTLINALAGTRVYCVCTVTHETVVSQASTEHERLHTLVQHRFRYRSRLYLHLVSVSNLEILGFH